MENISAHISYNEGIYSVTAKRLGLDNTPSEEILEQMSIVANKCFEPIREWVGNKIYISSFYRSVKVNKECGGEPTSNHITGSAIDLDMNVFGGKTNHEVFDWCVEQHKKGLLDFDELLWEGGYNGWIHIAYRTPSKNRHKIGEIPNPK